MRHPRAPRLPQPARLGLALALATLLAPAAWAQSSPYYIGIAQSVGYDSNLRRLGDNQALTGSAQSKSDVSFTTSLVGGIDQTWGRQRLSGSGSLRSNRYQKNDLLNNNGYGLNLGLDWATIERLSGNLSIASNRSLRRFDQSEQQAGKNIETNTLVSGTVRVGVVTRLTAEASLNQRNVGFSADAYRGSEYKQNGGSLGLRYRLGGATTVGATWRQSKTDFNVSSDDYDRRDIDLSVNWVPSGLSSVYARISHSSTDHDVLSSRDFSGFTGELVGTTQATGKLKLSTRLARDTGLSSSTFDAGASNLGNGNATIDFNRTSTSLRLSADYEATAKISATSALEYTRRNLSQALSSDFTLDGSDNTTALSLGARWLPTRSTQLSCSLSYERRSANSTVSLPYSNSGINCYGQIVLQ